MRKIEAAALVLSGSVLLNACADKIKPSNIPSTPFPAPTGEVYGPSLPSPEATLSPDQSVILNEIQNKGIEKDQSEIDLWAPTFEPLPSFNSSAEEMTMASNIINSTLNRMKSSKNQRFQVASNYLDSLDERLDVTITQLEAGNPSRIFWGLHEGLDPLGQITHATTFKLDLTLGFLLEANPLSIATSLVGMAEIIKEYEKRGNSLPQKTLSAVELNKLMEGSEQDWVRMNAHAFEEQERSYIEEVGLLGGNFYGEPRLKMDYMGRSLEKCRTLAEETMTEVREKIGLV